MPVAMHRHRSGEDRTFIAGFEVVERCREEPSIRVGDERVLEVWIAVEVDGLPKRRKPELLAAGDGDPRPAVTVVGEDRAFRRRTGRNRWGSIRFAS